MSLYIKLHCSYWNHRKTLRLRSLIGDDAYWVMPRLWCWAATHQPDGDLSSLSPDEITMSIGYLKDSQSLLKGLQQASFMDNGRLASWEEHSGYHANFADRARKANDARWATHRAKLVSPQTPLRRDGDGEGDKESIKDALRSHHDEPEPTIPASLDSEAFRKVWGEWCAFRKKVKRVKDFDLLRRKTLEKMEPWGRDAAIHALNNSMAGEWQGVFQPKDGPAAQKPFIKPMRSSEDFL